MTNKTIATKTLTLTEQATEIFDKSVEIAKPTHLIFSLRMKVIFKKFYGVKLTQKEQRVFEQMEKEYDD